MKIKVSILICLFLSIGCGWMTISMRSALVVPLNLSFTGPNAIATGECRRFKIHSLDAASNPLTLTVNASISVLGNGSGTFYSDLACASAATAVTIPAGSNSVWVYFKDAANESLSFMGIYSALSATLSVTTSTGGPVWNAIIANGTASPPDAPKLVAMRLAYHDVRQTTLLYGGELDGGFPYFTLASAYAGMWEYNGSSWTQLCNSCSPGARSGHGLVYDSYRNKIVLVGGGNSTNNYMNDTWEWDGTNWTQVCSSCGFSGRVGFYMAYDSSRHKTVLFGGQTAAGPTFNNEVWEYDGTSWSGPIVPGLNPGARGSGFTAGATFDPIHGVTYIYSDTAYDADLWSWNGTTWTNVCGGACPPVGRDGAGVSFDIARNKLVITQGYDGAEVASTSEMDGTTHVWTGPVAVPMAARDSMGFVYNPDSGRHVFFGGNDCGSGCNYNDTYEYGFP